MVKSNGSIWTSEYSHTKTISVFESEHRKKGSILIYFMSFIYKHYDSSYFHSRWNLNSLDPSLPVNGFNLHLYYTILLTHQLTIILNLQYDVSTFNRVSNECGIICNHMVLTNWSLSLRLVNTCYNFIALPASVQVVLFAHITYSSPFHQAVAPIEPIVLTWLRGLFLIIITIRNWWLHSSLHSKNVLNRISDQL